MRFVSTAKVLAKCIKVLHNLKVGRHLLQGKPDARRQIADLPDTSQECKSTMNNLVMPILSAQLLAKILLHDTHRQTGNIQNIGKLLFFCEISRAGKVCI